MILKRVGPLSFAKISSLVYAVIGFFIGLIVTIGSLAGVATRQGGAADVLFGIGSVIVLPILYAAIGFISSWLLASVYNIISKKFGGLEIDVQ